VEPVRRDRGHVVERCAQGFPEEFEAREHPDSRHHLSCIGALLPVRLEHAEGPTAGQEGIEEALDPLPGHEAGAKRTQHAEMKARIRQFQSKEILPVNARPDGVGSLAIGQLLPELHHRHQGEVPR
jgi:hypothetical protein